MPTPTHPSESRATGGFAKTAAVILAAGQGTRMKSATPKVLHTIAGRPLVHYPVAAARDAGLELVGSQESPITGREGNREFFLHLRKP